MKRTWPELLALKMEEWAVSRGMPATSRSWKGKKTDSPLGTRGGMPLADTLILAH